MCRPPPPSCATCDKQEGLLLCTGCKVVHYCCRDHQIEHRPAHKDACNLIKKANKEVEIEEALLRAAEIECGYALSLSTYKFGSRFHTARAILFHGLTAISTKASLQAQLDNLLRVFLLGSHTAPFARYYVQSLMLRLGRDQECFDLIVWYRKVIDVPAQDWANEAQYGVGVKGADPLETYKISVGGATELDLKINRALITTRIIVDWETMKDMGALNGTKKPQKKSVKIQPNLLESSIVANNPDIFKGRDKYLGGVMTMQLLTMILMIQAENKHYFPALLSPDALTKRNKQLHYVSSFNNSWRSDSLEIANALVELTIDAWLSTPKAFDYMRKQYENTTRLQREHHIPVPYDAFSGRSADEIVRESSVSPHLVEQGLTRMQVGWECEYPQSADNYDF